MVQAGAVLLVVVVVALVAAIVVLAVRAERKRKAAIVALAERTGWSYTERDDAQRPRAFDAFEPFGKGDRRYAEDVFSGRRGDAGFEAFSYHFQVTTGAGKDRRTSHHWFKVCVVSMPVPCPGLSIRDEHIGHKLWDAFGGEDIDFESDAFSKRFWVKGEDRRFVHDVVHTGMMGFLMEHRGLVWQWRGDRLVVFAKGRFRPEEYEAAVERAARFRALVPRHLLAP